jgi:hypothetical protein
MDWQTGSQIAEIASAIGVITTLAYLAFQISQTNRIANSANIREVEQQYLDLYKLIATDPVFTDLVIRLRDAEYCPESEIDEERLENFASIVVTIWFSTQVAYDRKQMDSNAFQIYRDDVKVKLAKWPAIKPYVTKFLESYPGAKDLQIFEPIYG